MARSRRTQSGAVRLVPLLKAVVLCTLIGGSAVGYVVQKNKIFELGQQLREREARLERLKWENKIRASALAEMQLPQRLAERVKELRLGLVPPPPAQVVWLHEPGSNSVSNSASALYVQRR